MIRTFYMPGQPPPKPPEERPVVFTNARGQNADHIRGMFAGIPCFLVGGGPSLNQTPLHLLQQRGILTAAMNNVAATHVRPHLWFSVDVPYQFHEAIWRDPGVMKFTKEKWLKKDIHSWTGTEFLHTGERVKTMPNVYGYKHTNNWNAATFLTQDFPTWGPKDKSEDPEHKRTYTSVMLIALRLLHLLGVRTIYLVGCDFKMKDTANYAFEENPKNVEGNNELYGWLARRFEEMRGHFAENKLRVVNCTVGGRLDVFPRMELAAAVDEALARFPKQIVTRGHYRQ